MNSKTSEATFLSHRQSQMKKFSALLVKTSSRGTEKREVTNNTVEIPDSLNEQRKWIVNLSDHTLSANETTALEKGLNFSPTPTKLPVIDIISSVESVLRLQNNQKAAEQARAAICNMIRKARVPTSNISKKERQAVEALKNDKEIVIVRADKDKATVIMNTTDYEHKALEILNNPPFKKTRKDLSN